jgi:tetratricopeptide (TPR) repeat protein
MWPEAAASNETAWAVSDAWMKRKNLSPSVRDYHSLHWLLYVYLQQGRYRKAEELLSLMKQTMAGPSYDNKLRPGYYENNYANMAAAFVVETERWTLASTLFSTSETASASGTPVTSHSHGAVSAPAEMTVRSSGRGQRLPVFVLGLAAALNGSAGSLQTDVNVDNLDVNELEVAALAASVKGNHERALALMRQATNREEQLGPPSGPPSLVKPAHELFGEILLRADKPADAIEQFNVALLRQPNRARSLLGLARAAAKLGDRAAASAAYQKLLTQWQQADADLSELKEAQDYLKTN